MMKLTFLTVIAFFVVLGFARYADCESRNLNCSQEFKDARDGCLMAAGLISSAIAKFNETNP
jgi:hypothetical protein